MLPIRRALLATLLALPLLAGTALAAEIKVMSSGGFHSALDALAPAFEKATGHKVTKIYGASMGAVPTAVPNRLARGEAADLVIIAGEAIDKLIEEGKLQPGSRTDLVFSRIGVMVKAGAPQPDISTPAAVKAMLLAAPSIAYSDSASGVYISSRFFQGLGITDQMARNPSRCRAPSGSPRSSPPARPRSASSRSARSWASPASPWSARCRRRSSW